MTQENKYCEHCGERLGFINGLCGCRPPTQENKKCETPCLCDACLSARDAEIARVRADDHQENKCCEKDHEEGKVRTETALGIYFSGKPKCSCPCHQQNQEGDQIIEEYKETFIALAKYDQQNQEKFCEHGLEMSYACPLCGRAGREYGKSAKPENQERHWCSQDCSCKENQKQPKSQPKSENQESEWEKEFDALFVGDVLYFKSEDNGNVIEYLRGIKFSTKNFIRQLLSNQKKGVNPESYKQGYDEGYEHGLAWQKRDLVEIIGGIGDFGEGTYPKKDGKTYATKDFKIGYNAARDEILDLLKRD